MKLIPTRGRSKILLALTLLLVINTVQAACLDAKFIGTITDQDSNTLGSAYVTAECPGKDDKSVYTDGNGEYELPLIENVCGDCWWCSPVCKITAYHYNYHRPQSTNQRIEVETGETEVNLVLGDNVCDPDPCRGMDYCRNGKAHTFYCWGNKCDDKDNPDKSCCGENIKNCEYGCIGDRCKNGPCDGVTCNNYCAGDTLHYSGHCNGGRCKYKTMYCTFGCSNGACNGDPCAGITCDDKCEGSTRYYNGYCSEGDCHYSTQECDYGCSNTYCYTRVVTSKEANVDYSYNAQNYLSCTGDGTKNHNCLITSTPFYISSTPSDNGYLTINDYQSSDLYSEVELEHDVSLMVDLSSINPTRGLLNVSPYDSYNVASIYESSGLYYLPVPTGAYTITYDDGTNRYEYTGGGENVNLDTGSQTTHETVSLTLTETTHTFIITLTDDNNNNALITSASVDATYDNGEHACTNNGDGTYSCDIPHNTEFNIKAVKNGYVTQEVYTTPQVILGPQAAQLDLIRTLKVNLMDDLSQPVDTGVIYVDDADGENLLSHDLSGNSDIEIYLTAPPQEVKVYYIDGYEFSASNVENAVITSNSQTTINLGVEDTWPTDVNAFTQTGSLSDYNIWVDSELVQEGGPTIGLNRYSHVIKVKKPGYLTNETTVPSMNNGSPVSLLINHTLNINVTDQNGDLVSGTIKVYNSSDVKISESSFSNSTAWVAVDPSENDEALTIYFESDEYVNVEDEIPVNVLSDQETYYQNLNTQNQTTLIIKAEDHYSNLELSDINIKVWNDDTIYCTESRCGFEMFNPPERVNITVSKDGYFGQTLINKSTSSGTLAVDLKPRAVVFTNVKSNATIIDTKKTSSSLDDEELMNLSSNENGTNSLPLEADLEFMIRLWAFGYYSTTIGPYTTKTNETLVIASEDNPRNLLALYDQSGHQPPVITGLGYSPTNLTNIDDITITLNATDVNGGNHTIDICYYRIDRGFFWDAFESDYDDYTISASKNVGPLSNGVHNVTAVCHDVNDSLGPEEMIQITVGSELPDEDEDDEEEDDEEPSENRTVSKTLRLSNIRKNYEVIVKTGLNTESIAEAVNNAESKINTDEASNALSQAEETIPTVTLVKSGNVKTAKSTKPEQIAHKVTSVEKQPYSVNELKNLIKNVAVTKSARTYQINGATKTLIKLTVYSQKRNPSAVVADFNPGDSSAPNTITTSEGSISYFKGLSSGENVFEYVVDGDVSETIEPVVFEMKPLSDAEKALKDITGLSIKLPGLFEVPVIYIGVGAVLLFLIIKFFVI